jgi:polyhydroxybutyrate depolymerase
MMNLVPKKVALGSAATMVALALVCTACSTRSTGGSTLPSTRPSTIPGAAAGMATGAPVPSSGCAAAQGAAVTDERQDIEVGGAARWYLLTTPGPDTPGPQSAGRTGAASPQAASLPRPLVLDFHGLVEGAAVHSTTSMFGELGQKDGFVVAFPNGTGTPVKWDTTDQGSSNPDLRFVSAMLVQLESNLCIDTSRVYASGLSDGAFMVSLLACTMSGQFAAIAAVSGLQTPTPCPTHRRVPIIAFHGTADPILFFNGGIGRATLGKILGGGAEPTGQAPTTTTTTQPVDLHGSGYPAAVQKWAVRDGCDPRSSDSRVAGEVILRSYRCPAGTDVEFYIILGGGHSWPGSAFSRSISSVTGYTTFEIDATRTIWAFFERFRL